MTSQGKNDTDTLDKQLNEDVQDQIRNLHLDNDRDSDSSSSYDNSSAFKLEGFEDDTSSTLYNDTSSTLYANNDTSTSVGGNEYARPAATKHIIVPDDLRNINIVVVGYDIRLESKGKEGTYCILSVRQLLRRNDQDLINNRYRELWKIAKCYADLLKFDSEASTHYAK